jgi:CBS domain-containing protein
VKHGGIAALQADAAAEAIARDTGVPIEPRPFRPLLRGLLLTGGAGRFLRHDPEAEDGTTASTEPLWWPPAKIAGRHLAPYLAARTGLPPARPEHGVAVEVELGPADRVVPGVDSLASDPGAARHGGRTVADVMSTALVVIAPEDTLGEVAERLRERGVASAVVADFGRLIGILTARDLLRAYAGRAHPSEARVREWMTAEPIAVTPATTLDAAALLMSEHAIHHLPVVDGTRPVGVVGLRDVVRPALAGDGPRSAIGLGF